MTRTKRTSSSMPRRTLLHWRPWATSECQGVPLGGAGASPALTLPLLPPRRTGSNISGTSSDISLEEQVGRPLWGCSGGGCGTGMGQGGRSGFVTLLVPLPGSTSTR